MKENINALDEISKGTCMGMDAIDFIMDKVQDKKFKSDLEVQYKKYSDIKKEIDKLYSKYNDTDTPHKPGVVTKMMTWTSVEMKTFNDTSNSKIAELLMQGTNMGIIEGRKILNKKEIAPDVRDIVDKYVTMQEDSIENIKKYL